MIFVILFQQIIRNILEDPILHFRGGGNSIYATTGSHKIKPRAQLNRKNDPLFFENSQQKCFA